MDPWFEAVGVVLIAALGVALGFWLRRLRAAYWALGYVLAVVLVTVLLLGRVTTLQFVPPFSWLVATRVRFVLVALAATLGLTSLLPRLPHRWERIATCMLMSGILARSSLLPLLMPALIHDRLARLESTVDENGVCLQATRYTCGPAAATTALWRLGLPAREGHIAILSRSSPAAGTLPASLCGVLTKQYAADGLRCCYRRFSSIAELSQSGITLAIVRNALLRDHCVAVLEVSDQVVTVADPITGVMRIPREEFRTMWRYRGIELMRVSPVGDDT